MAETAGDPIISCILSYEKNGDKHDNVNTVLFPDSITFDAPGFSSCVKLNTLSGVSASGYRIFVKTDDGDIILSMMGRLYEDFALRFVHAYNEVVFSESLMSEAIHFKADGQYVSPDNVTAHAVFRICETALVILPDTHGLVRIPFCMFGKTEITPYRFAITNRLNRTYVLQKMGRITDVFMKAYETRVSELSKQTRERLSGIAPVNDALAALLMEGMVAKLSDVRAINERFADAVDKKLLSSELSEEYGYLKAVSSQIAIGLKRGLMGELTGETIIILAPVFEKNIMIMESLGDTAAATYVFNLTKSGNAYAEQWDELLLSFNYSMLSVNFRREPIYLSEEALRNENNAEYNMALRRVPELARLRSLFVGRVIHSSFESWKKAIDSYIK